MKIHKNLWTIMKIRKNLWKFVKSSPRRCTCGLPDVQHDHPSRKTSLQVPQNTPQNTEESSQLKFITNWNVMFDLWPRFDLVSNAMECQTKMVASSSSFSGSNHLMWSRSWMDAKTRLRSENDCFQQAPIHQPPSQPESSPQQPGRWAARAKP